MAINFNLRHWQFASTRAGTHACSTTRMSTTAQDSEEHSAWYKPTPGDGRICATVYGPHAKWEGGQGQVKQLVAQPLFVSYITATGAVEHWTLTQPLRHGSPLAQLGR